MSTLRVTLALIVFLAMAPPPARAQQLLVPMDAAQEDHLRAYGLVYNSITADARAEWLLNFRSGSFLLPDTRAVRRRAALMGVTVEAVSGGELARIRATIEASNMEAVPLEKAPKIAVYTPPNSSPWDDAVTIALEYAEIEYDKVWDVEVIEGELETYDWLHLHHEDFTGQYSKFFLAYAGTAWLQEEVARNEGVAERFGYADVPTLKKAVARQIRDYVEQGGFLFAMCTATETLDLALAGVDVDFAAAFADGTPIDPAADEKMNWQLSLAFQDAVLVLDPGVSAFSDIDGHQVNTSWRRSLGSFTLFDFSAKVDPVQAMLTQSHERVVSDFYGLTTSFLAERVKPPVSALAMEADGEIVKYLHGSLGEGSFTFLGGHDPEDPQHLIGDAPTDLSLHRHSAGYRLILNNVLYPAARKKALKT